MVKEIDNMNYKVAVCVISTNNSYVYKSIITLLSVKENNKKYKEFEYFVCGNISDKYKKVIEKYNLKVIKLDLKDTFDKSEGSIWPNESFWLCAVPEILYERGFKYSLILDGDVFCLKEIPIDRLTNIRDFGFVKSLKFKNRPDIRNFYKCLIKYDPLKEFGCEENLLEEDTVNSGVVIFNNESLAEKRFRDKFITLYQKSSTIIQSNSDSRIHDEFIFFLIQISKFFHFEYFSDIWNKFISGAVHVNESIPDDEIIFLHLQYKPWKYKFLWSKPEGHNVDDNKITEFNEKRMKYRELYINFCKKTYKNKFCLYYIEHLIPLKDITNITKVRRWLKTVRF